MHRITDAAKTYITQRPENITAWVWLFCVVGWIAVWAFTFAGQAVWGDSRQCLPTDVTECRASVRACIPIMHPGEVFHIKLTGLRPHTTHISSLYTRVNVVYDKCGTSDTSTATNNLLTRSKVKSWPRMSPISVQTWGRWSSPPSLSCSPHIASTYGKEWSPENRSRWTGERSDREGVRRCKRNESNSLMKCKWKQVSKS